MASDSAELPRASRRPADDSSGNKAAARVLAVLGAFTGDSTSLGATEISRRLGITKSMAYRALTTLVDEGWLIRDPSSTRYQLGYRVLEFAGPAGTAPELPDLCMPYMRRMHELTGETVALTVRRGPSAVTIGGIEGRGSIARRVPLGRVVPLHISAAARAILAFLDDEEIEEYLANGPLPQVTPTSLHTAEQVWDDVKLTRDRDYAIGLFDHVRTAYGAGFPVLDRVGYPHGSVTVSGPKDRLTRQLLDELLPGLLAIAADMHRHSRLYRAVRRDI
jgi:IclR family transcriptional regulator, KDG regulon repressor